MKSASEKLAAQTAAIEAKEHIKELACLKELVRHKPLTFKVWDEKKSNGRTLQSNEKIVHFVRHGQGFHNLFADHIRGLGHEFSSKGIREEVFNPYKLSELTDPPLTVLGRAQAAQNEGKKNPQVVVVSSMTRAIQTGLLSFKHLLGKDVPFIAHEGCREQTGVHKCDDRRDLEDLRFDFPMIDFRDIPEKDPLVNDEVREPKENVMKRAYEFMEWICAREEVEIGVVSHSAFLITLFSAVLDCQDEGLARWFDTGEMRSVLLVVEKNSAQLS